MKREILFRGIINEEAMSIYANSVVERKSKNIDFKVQKEKEKEMQEKPEVRVEKYLDKIHKEYVVSKSKEREEFVCETFIQICPELFTETPLSLYNMTKEQIEEKYPGKYEFLSDCLKGQYKNW